MKLTIYNSKQTKKFLQQIEQQFGFKWETNFYFMESGKQKVYVINKELNQINLDDLRIDTLGLYIGKYQIDGFRPSIEGSQLIGPLATKNVVEINQEQRHLWLKGFDIEINGPEEIILVKYESDFLGAGKIVKNKLLTGIPKSRRLNVVNEEFD